MPVKNQFFLSNYRVDNAVQVLLLITMSVATATAAGDVLLIPDPSTAGAAVKRVVVEWSQGWSGRTAEYYTFFAHNKSRNNAEVLCFIAAEKFTHDHLNTIGKLDGENYEVTIDNKYQYGQKNKTGENRFIVYHDKERKPYQHRFIEGCLANQAAAFAEHVAKYFGQASAGSALAGIAKSAFGDYLHDY